MEKHQEKLRNLLCDLYSSQTSLKRITKIHDKELINKAAKENFISIEKFQNGNTLAVIKKEGIDLLISMNNKLISEKKFIYVVTNNADWYSAGHTQAVFDNLNELNQFIPFSKKDIERIHMGKNISYGECPCIRIAAFIPNQIKARYYQE